MEAYIADWLNLLVRWLHVIAGIAWIGSSFYFVWLDGHLQSPEDPRAGAEGVEGELWSVHGGGFYHARKYRVAPTQIPETLHWFKWEAYTTWISGMAMLALVYWYGAEVYLVNPSVADLSAAQAVGISIAFIVGGWFVYDLLCKSPLARDARVFGVVLILLCSILAWSLCQLFGGRAAYIQFGSVLGTIMVANVFFVIIPGQKKTVASALRSETPDPTPGIHAKQRSVHNTYFTLPVLFVMTSNHYAMTYGHEYNWVVLIGISLVGALVRIYFVERHKGRASLAPLVVSVVLLAAIAAAITPRSQATGGATASFDEVRRVVSARCSNCHAETPVHPAFPAPPLGVMLDTDERIVAEAARIYQQTVVTRVMPIGNLTAMTEDERQIIDHWYQGLQDR